MCSHLSAFRVATNLRLAVSEHLAVLPLGFAETFGSGKLRKIIHESTFKFYVRGILGESYLAYFRRKRMEKAAAMLESTNMKVIEIANAVGYENQGKFARVFAETYGVAPLEFRRLSK